ncbi:MAG: STAS domain-containing protein [Steroidobacteraceae bacterium]
MARRNPRVDSASQPAALAVLGPGRFALSGDIGFGDAARMLKEGDAAFGDTKDIEIDLAKVALVDSAGLALLLEWSIAARESGRTISYRNLPPAIAALAGISDVSELLAPAASGGG